MSRMPRKQCESNIYHVFARGVGRMQIFEDREDNSYFLGLLERMASSESCTILAYCLMGNHFHLVVRMPMNELSEAMRRLEVSYAQYFNEKYERTGTLFQGRFGSEPINSDEQLLAAIRYVHFNPDKAGIAPFDAYEWSSYQDYEGAEGIADTSLFLNLIGGRNHLEAFHRSRNDSAIFMEESTGAGKPGRKRLSDREVREIAKSELGLSNLLDLSTLERGQRDTALAHLKSNGATVRQLERLTGISRGVIGRA